MALIFDLDGTLTDPGVGILGSIRFALESLGAPVPEPDHPVLHEPGATFVTLTQHGELRGCIGSLEAWRTLEKDVRDNARSAARTTM